MRIQETSAPQHKVPRVAIIGGGPGGLFTCYRLQQRSNLPYNVTIYEASDRLGGKIRTEAFASAPVSFEAGAAELYDYSHLGEDPLRELIEGLGLSTQPMDGRSVVVGDTIVRDAEHAGQLFGERTRQALEAFDRRAHQWMSPEEYYESDWTDRGNDSLSGQTFHDELARVEDDDARRFLATLVHSDLATEPHLTSASYGLQNYLMNDPAYLRLYTIVGGIEQLPKAVAAELEAEVRLGHRVTEVRRTSDGMLVLSRHAGVTVAELYDFVVVALPNSHLPAIAWRGGELERAMDSHHQHYEYPAHYLRISILFREVFWHDHLPESYLMLDAFGGCCLYNESSRNGAAEYGTLGWLLAGEAAMTAANLTDVQLIERALASLPPCLEHGADTFLEGRVQRWIGEVNGLPGGAPAQAMDQRHIPDAACPLFTVGDYLFDSTLNGVLDSAEFVADLLVDGIQALSAGAPQREVLSGAA